MDELVDILDANGNNTGKVCLKSEAHLHGYWHGCVDIWLYTVSGKVLLQKRSSNKDVFSNLWDVSVAGHISVGELPLLAAQRELFEEIGLEVKSKQLKKIGNYKTDFKHHQLLIDREYHHIYMAKLKVPLKKLVLQIEEVSELKLVVLEQLKKELNEKETKSKYVPYPSAYIKMVFKALLEVLR